MKTGTVDQETAQQEADWVEPSKAHPAWLSPACRTSIPKAPPACVVKTQFQIQVTAVSGLSSQCNLSQEAMQQRGCCNQTSQAHPCPRWVRQFKRDLPSYDLASSKCWNPLSTIVPQVQTCLVGIWHTDYPAWSMGESVSVTKSRCSRWRGHVCKCPGYSRLTGCESSQELAQTASPCLWCPLLLTPRNHSLLHLPIPVLPILNGLWGCPCQPNECQTPSVA